MPFTTMIQPLLAKLLARRFNPYAHLRLAKPIPVDVYDRRFQSEDVARPYTIVTTVRNEAQTLAAFLDGLKEQAYPPDQIVIVDGGSQDGTLALLEEYAATADFDMEVVAGGEVNIARGRNIGIARSRNELIVFTDAGCRLEKHCTLNLLGPLSEHDYDMVCGIFHGATDSPYNGEFICDWEKTDWNEFLPSARAVLVKKSLCERVGGFPEYLTLTGEDTWFDIMYRRVSSRWAVNKQACAIWPAPATRKKALELVYSYGKGEGENGVGDFHFYRLLRYSRFLGLSRQTMLAAQIAGCMAGRANRARLEIVKRGIRGVVVILSGVPITDSGGGQRGAQLALELVSRNYKVIYVNVYPSYEEARKIYLDADYSLLELYHLPDFSVKDMAARYREVLDRTVIVTEFPHPRFMGIVEQFKRIEPRIRYVFDYIDNWNSSLGWEWYTEEAEARLVRAADFLIASAGTLREGLEGKSGREVHLIANAVNLRLFDAHRTYPRPADLPEGERVVLYVGAMWGEWFDWELVEHAVKSLPDHRFVFIGTADAAKVADLSARYANVAFLGLRPQGELPAYIRHADVCLIPFRLDHITAYVNPLKVYEYLAMGKPVVATAMPELAAIPGVLSASDAEGFTAQISAACIRGSTVAPEAMRDHSWEARADRLLALLGE